MRNEYTRQKGTHMTPLTPEEQKLVDAFTQAINNLPPLPPVPAPAPAVAAAAPPVAPVPAPALQPIPRSSNKKDNAHYRFLPRH